MDVTALDLCDLIEDDQEADPAVLRLPPASPLPREITAYGIRPELVRPPSSTAERRPFVEEEESGTRRALPIPSSTAVDDPYLDELMGKRRGDSPSIFDRLSHNLRDIRDSSIEALRDAAFYTQRESSTVRIGLRHTFSPEGMDEAKRELAAMTRAGKLAFGQMVRARARKKAG